MARDSLNLAYISLAGVMVLVIVAGFLVIRPSAIEMMQSREQLVRTQQTTQERQDFLHSIDQKLATLQTQSTQEQELAVALPAEEAFDDMLRTIDRSAAAAGLIVHSIENDSAAVQAAHRASVARGEPVTIPEKALPLGASLQVRGTYQQLRQFISALENNIRIMDLLELKINTDNVAADQLQASLDIRFYAHENLENIE